MAAFLVASGAEIDARNARGDTPLHLAASTGHIAVAETLIASGADLNAQNDVDDAPILDAGVSDHFDIVDLLIVHGVSAPPVDPITDLLADTDPEKGASCSSDARVATRSPGTIDPIGGRICGVC